MKFSVTKEKLLECLQQVQNVVSTRTTLPILSNVLLQTNGSEVRLTTTDLDVGVRHRCHMLALAAAAAGRLFAGAVETLRELEGSQRLARVLRSSEQVRVRDAVMLGRGRKRGDGAVLSDDGPAHAGSAR